MTPEEAQLINGIHDRLDQASSQYRDSEAENLILKRVTANPHAPYLLTQSVLVRQQAVSGAQSRIADLEKQLAEAKSQTSQGGSFLSNLFGSPVPPQPSFTARPIASPTIPQQPVPSAHSQGGSFLQTALGTAAGVAGGALLFQGIENLMGHNPGPFGGMGTSSGGFLGENQPTEIINNYYGSPDDSSANQSDGQGDPQFADNGQGQDDFDQGDDFSGGDDSSFV
jgi:hypothetical protein